MVSTGAARLARAKRSGRQAPAPAPPRRAAKSRLVRARGDRRGATEVLHLHLASVPLQGRVEPRHALRLGPLARSGRRRLEEAPAARAGDPAAARVDCAPSTSKES